MAGDQVSLSKNKNIFANTYQPNRKKKIFLSKRAKDTSPWTFAIEEFKALTM